MNWYRDNGMIVVCGGSEHLARENICLQMGTMRLPDGRLILTDHSLLWMCGKKRRRPSRKRAERTPPILALSRRIVKSAGENDVLGCVADKGLCRFYNDYFCTCSLNSADRRKHERCPCMSGAPAEEGGAE